MFRHACSFALQYTRPIVISRRAIDGTISGGAATFVVVNDEGWILTAGHVITQLVQGLAEEASAAAVQEERLAIEGDTILDRNAKQKKIKGLKWPPKNGTRNISAWFGMDGMTIGSYSIVPGVDLAICKLDGFNTSAITRYPVFKDPAKNFSDSAGVSLCRLGFPFNSVEPIYDPDKNTFRLENPSMALFPIEGILTRHVLVDTSMLPSQPKFPLELIETSSPGLRGQSGGPIFDAEGAIWAIQTNTVHYPLGFDIKATKEEQFLHVGRGASVATILPVLDELKVKYTKSEH